VDLSLFLRGLVIGFSIAAPVGPIGVLCIRRTLADGRAHGLVSGLGAATADAFFGTITAIGLTFVADFLINQQNWLRLLGGLFLLYLGVKTFLSKPAEQAANVKNQRGLWGAYFSTLLLTLTNPLTILSFAAIFAGLGPGASSQYTLGALLIVIGVFTGSCAWWLILVTATGLFRSAFTPARLGWVNRLSGVIIVAFAIVILIGIVSA